VTSCRCLSVSNGRCLVTKLSADATHRSSARPYLRRAVDQGLGITVDQRATPMSPAPPSRQFLTVHAVQAMYQGAVTLVVMHLSRSSAPMAAPCCTVPTCGSGAMLAQHVLGPRNGAHRVGTTARQRIFRPNAFGRKLPTAGMTVMDL